MGVNGEDILPAPTGNIMQWAAVSSGDGGPKRMCHINEIPTKTDSLRITCLECGEPLIPRRGSQMRHHFAHTSGSDCHGESASHKLGKSIIMSAHELRAPRISKMIRGETVELPGFLMSYKDPVLERRLEGTPYIPDILVQTERGPVSIEILVTHTPEPEKVEVFKTLGISILEIDASGIMGMSKRDAINAVLFSAKRRWLTNKDFEILLYNHVPNRRSCDPTKVNQDYKVKAAQALSDFRNIKRDNVGLLSLQEENWFNSLSLASRGIQGNPFLIPLRRIHCIVAHGLTSGKSLERIVEDIRSRGYILPFSDDTILCRLVYKATGIDLSPMGTISKMSPISITRPMKPIGDK